MDSGHAETLDRIIDALYRAAADPDAWSELVDVLPEQDDLDTASHNRRRDLARGLQIAEQVAARVALQGPRTEPALLLLDGNLRVIAVTPQARLAVEPALGQVALGQLLVFDDPDNAEALLQAVNRVRGEPGPTMVRFSGALGDRPIFAYLAPAIDPSPGLATGLRLLFATTHQPGADLRLSLGLTAAETRVASQFRLSGSLPDVAKALGVSVHTARNQLASVFAKLGIGRQSDLIRILTELSVLGSWIEDPAATTPEACVPELRTLSLSDGRRLCYRQYGDPTGKVLLTFHEGLGSSLLPFETDGLAWRLGLRIISIDRPGFGGSDRDTSYSFHSIAEDVESLCDQLRLDQVAIAGLMSGAPSALQTAIRLGARVRRVLLCSGRPPYAGRPDLRNPLLLFRAQLESNIWFIETLYGILRSRLSPAMVKRSLMRAVASSPGDQAYLADHPEITTLISAYVAEALANGGTGPADDLRAFRRSANLTLDGLTAPLSIWHGEEDRLAPLDDLLRFVGDRPYDLRVVPGIGQLMVLKHWREVLGDTV